MQVFNQSNGHAVSGGMRDQPAPDSEPLPPQVVPPFRPTFLIDS